MIRTRLDLGSRALGMDVTVSALLPQRAECEERGLAREPGAWPVLYLLHGLSGDDTDWSRYTSVERYARDRGVAVIMPSGAKSFYTDEAHGSRYWTYLADELPRTLADTFGLSTRREDTFVAGNSMGGYGAFKWALRRPETFAAAASLSGALDVGAFADLLAAAASASVIDQDRARLADTIYAGANPRGTDDDLLALLARAEPAALPRLWMICGTDDDLLAHSQAFAAAAAARGVDVEAQYPAGGHEWALWDRGIEAVLAWLPLV